MQRPVIDLLASQHFLRDWMMRSGLTAAPGNTAIGVFTDREASIVQSDVEGVHELAGDVRSRETRFPSGCFAKTLTAMLVLDTAASGRFGLDTPITTLTEVPAATPFAGITVRQLLNHTHGLDVSALSQIPRTPESFIHLGALHDHLTRIAALAQPGEIYSYSNAGAWLLAAILEQLWGKTYSELLHVKILEPLGIRAARPSDRTLAVCPAAGSGLDLAIRDFVRLARLQLGYLPREPTERASTSPEALVRTPGWSLEWGVWLAWKYYGDGWYGHNMSYGRASGCLRIHPVRNCGIVLISDTHPAMLLLGRLCGSILPEFQRLTLPAGSTRSLDRQTAENLAGDYATAALQATVALGDDGHLEIRLRDRSTAASASPEVVSRLSTRADNLFMLEPGARAYCNWVQFIQSRQSECRYLWNGRHVLRRR